MIPALILLVAGLTELPAHPAYFKVEVEAQTPVVLFIAGQRIEPGRVYKTELLTRDTELVLTARFVRGDRVIEETFTLTVQPGYQITFTLTISARPQMAWC